MRSDEIELQIRFVYQSEGKKAPPKLYANTGKKLLPFLH